VKEATMQGRRGYVFVQVDVFTERMFGGNPLAVFPHAEGLTDEEMAAIAREMNLSETTFVLPPTHPDCAARVRIFTPARELPFAGHPTLGTAYTLAAHGMLAADARAFALEEGIGPVPVRLEGDDLRAPTFVWMEQRDPTFGSPTPDRATFAAALGLTENNLLPDAPILTGSAGLPFWYVPVRDAATVDRTALDASAMLRCIAGSGAEGIVVFAPDPDPARGRVYTRVFVPNIPVEDPGTGSASGPLGAWLAERGYVTPDAEGNVQIVSEQGTHMGRPNFIHVRLRLHAGHATAVTVGGGVVPVLEGTLWLP